MGKIKAIPIPMIYGLISNVIPQTQKSDTRLMLHFSISGYLEPWCVYYNDGDLIRVFEWKSKPLGFRSLNEWAG